MAIEIRDSSDNVIAKYEVLTRPFFPFEKKSVDTVTNGETVNPNFDASSEDQQRINDMSLRSIRNKAIACTDIWMLEDALSSAKAVYKTAEKDAIKVFRQELRDWPATLKTNGFSDIETPVVPSFVPTKEKLRIESILMDAQL